MEFLAIDVAQSVSHHRESFRLCDSRSERCVDVAIEGYALLAGQLLGLCFQVIFDM